MARSTLRAKRAAGDENIVERSEQIFSDIRISDIRYTYMHIVYGLNILNLGNVNFFRNLIIRNFKNSEMNNK